MTVQTRLAELIEHGAAIQLTDPRITLTLAGALWLIKPRRLRWCAIFPEHQGHIHETRYTRTEIYHGRDIAFHQGRVMVAYVCSYEEGPLPVEEVREALARWRDLLGKHGNVAEFAEFLAEA
jgi:hypothetical protein